MRSVLLLGDSHTVGTYGQALEKVFAKNGWDVTRVGWVGARADHYLDGKYRKIGLGGAGDYEAATKRHFDLAVVTLGTNDAANLTVNGPAQEAAKKIKRLIDGLDAGAILYVGPPAFHPSIAKTYNKAFAKDDLIARADRLWAAVSPMFPGRAFDPRQLTAPFVNPRDIHFDGRGAPKGGGKAWAQAVYSQATGDVPVSQEPAVAQGEPPRREGTPAAPPASESSGPGMGTLLIMLGLGVAAWGLMRRKP